MVSSLCFGSYPWYIYCALFRLGFPVTPARNALACNKDKLVGSFFNRHAVEVQAPLRLLVNIRFQVYFTPLPGFFSPFPHGTSSLSVDYEYLALEDGPPMFRQDFSCPALLVVILVPQTGFRIRGYHPLSLDFPFHSTNAFAKNNRLFHVRSPLLTESRLISFPRAT